MTKRTPKQIFLQEVAKHTGFHEVDFDNIVEYQCRNPGKSHIAVVGEAHNGKLFIAENGFLRQYMNRANQHWTCKVLSTIKF